MTAEIKIALRKDMRAKRELLQQQSPNPALRLAALPFPCEPRQGFATVSGFFPHGSEIDTRPLLGKLAGEGWTTALPVVVSKGQPLLFRRWLPGEPMEMGAMKIPVPLASAPLLEPDILLIPMLAFDLRGHRLGYGGGFYDATLSAYRARKPIVAIGVAYAGQEVQSLPHEAHDARLDYVMTEAGIVKCA